jgi:hypothetical protein
MVFAPGLDAVLHQIATSFPQTRLILDHLNVDVTACDSQIDAAIDTISPMADLPNVAVKISALPCHVREDYPYPSLVPRIQRAVQLFGPRRCFWGSDLSPPARDVQPVARRLRAGNQHLRAGQPAAHAQPGSRRLAALDHCLRTRGLRTRGLRTLGPTAAAGAFYGSLLPSAYSGEDAFSHLSCMRMEATAVPVSSYARVSYHAYSVLGLSPTATTSPWTW